jgi:hypothetical protein
MTRATLTLALLVLAGCSAAPAAEDTANQTEQTSADTTTDSSEAAPETKEGTGETSIEPQPAAEMEPKDVVGEYRLVSHEITNSPCGATRLVPEDLSEDKNVYRVEGYDMDGKFLAGLYGPGLGASENLVVPVDSGLRLQGSTGLSIDAFEAEKGYCSILMEMQLQSTFKGERAEIEGTFKLISVGENPNIEGTYVKQMCLDKAKKELGIESWDESMCPTSFRATLMRR